MSHQESPRQQFIRLRQLVKLRPPMPRAPEQDLVQRIEKWMAGMTPTERARRFTTSEVIALAQLKGKESPAPADHHVSQALRSLGFKHMRDWTVAGRNRRYWKFTGVSHV